MEITYRFDDDSYTALAAAGVDWRDVLFALNSSHPFVRRHIGAVLNHAARDRAGAWLAVAAIEQADDTYVVVGARYLDAAEVAGFMRMLGGQA